MSDQLGDVSSNKLDVRNDGVRLESIRKYIFSIKLKIDKSELPAKGTVAQADSGGL